MVKIEVDGKSYKLAFTMRSQLAFEKDTGITVLDFMDRLSSDSSKITLNVLCSLIWNSLSLEDQKSFPEGKATFLDRYNPDQATIVMLQLVADLLKEAYEGLFSSNEPTTKKSSKKKGI